MQLRFRHYSMGQTVNSKVAWGPSSVLLLALAASWLALAASWLEWLKSSEWEKPVRPSVERQQSSPNLASILLRLWSSFPLSTLRESLWSLPYLVAILGGVAGSFALSHRTRQERQVMQVKWGAADAYFHKSRY